jgi:hypothetical protein
MDSFFSPPPHGGVGAIDPLPSLHSWCGNHTRPSSSPSQARTNNDDDNAVSNTTSLALRCPAQLRQGYQFAIGLGVSRFSFRKRLATRPCSMPGPCSRKQRDERTRCARTPRRIFCWPRLFGGRILRVPACLLPLSYCTSAVFGSVQIQGT